jgi:hypothetical protein
MRANVSDAVEWFAGNRCASFDHHPGEHEPFEPERLIYVEETRHRRAVTPATGLRLP